MDVLRWWLEDIYKGPFRTCCHNSWNDHPTEALQDNFKIDWWWAPRADLRRENVLPLNTSLQLVADWWNCFGLLKLKTHTNSATVDLDDQRFTNKNQYMETFLAKLILKTIPPLNIWITEILAIKLQFFCAVFCLLAPRKVFFLLGGSQSS